MKVGDYARTKDGWIYKIEDREEYIHGLETENEKLKEELAEANKNNQTMFETKCYCIEKKNEYKQKYDKALETLVEYSMPCERDNFNLLDTDYCEKNCSLDEEVFKECWNKFIEWKLKDE